MVLGRGWRANNVCRGVEPEDQAGGDRRHGRRDRLGQDHPGQGRSRPREARRAALPSTAPQISGLGPGRQRRERRRGRVQLRVPGPAALARPRPDRRAASSARASDPRGCARREPDRAAATATRWPRSGSTRRCCAATPARSPAASGSGSPSPAPSPAARGCCSATSRSARWTPATGTTCCAFSASCAATSGCRSSSSPTTCTRWRHRRPGGGAVPRQDRRGRPHRQGFCRPRDPYTALLIASTPHVTQGRGLRSHQLRRQDGEPLPLLGPVRASSRPGARSPWPRAAQCSPRSARSSRVGRTPVTVTGIGQTWPGAGRDRAV